MILSGENARLYIKNNLKFFEPHEFECKCCGQILIETDLVETLEAMRKTLGHPVTVNSGFRCPAHNKAVAGVKNSPHMLGKAVDVKCVDSATRHDMLAFLIAAKVPRIGIGPDFIHFDYATGELYAQDRIWTYYPKNQGGKS